MHPLHFTRNVGYSQHLIFTIVLGMKHNSPENRMSRCSSLRRSIADCAFKKRNEKKSQGTAAISRNIHSQSRRMFLFVNQISLDVKRHSRHITSMKLKFDQPQNYTKKCFFIKRWIFFFTVIEFEYLVKSNSKCFFFSRFLLQF